jgi:hypothetical protein
MHNTRSAQQRLHRPSVLPPGIGFGSLHGQNAVGTLGVGAGLQQRAHQLRIVRS